MMTSAFDSDEDDLLDGAPSSNVVPVCATWTIEQCAAALDAAVAQPTQYALALKVREAFGVPAIATISTSVAGNPAATAALLVFEYHVTVSTKPARHLTLEPRDQIMGRYIPPAVRDLPAETIDQWQALLAHARTAPIRARLHHLLFQRRVPHARHHATTAADLYAESASRWTRPLDSVEDWSVALRLARAVADSARAESAMHGLLDLADEYLAVPDPPAGIILRALDAVIDERDCPIRIDELLATAETTWSDGLRRNQVLALSLKRATDASQREAIWTRRVQAHLDHAARETTSMMRSVRLRDALEVAEMSNIKGLRRLAATELEKVRDVVSEMARFRASSRQYEELFDRTVAAMSAGSRWDEKLVSVACFPPLSGDLATNRQLIASQHAASPLSALLPSMLYSPDGLPYYAGTSEEMRFAIDLAQQEQQHISHLIRPLVRALFDVVPDRQPPARAVLVGYLSQWPGVHHTAERLADVLLRYWAGDADGAAYIAAPLVERMVRELVEASGSGTYRLQRNESPGQFPALGGLLPILVEEYAIDESRARYLSTVLIDPAGLNLRNLMSHGYLGEGAPGTAALLIHCALLLAVRQLPEPAETPPQG